MGVYPFATLRMLKPIEFIVAIRAGHCRLTDPETVPTGSRRTSPPVRGECRIRSRPSGTNQQWTLNNNGTITALDRPVAQGHLPARSNVANSMTMSLTTRPCGAGHHVAADPSRRGQALGRAVSGESIARPEEVE